jgi:hypothetical protein
LLFTLELPKLLSLPSYNNINGIAYKDAANWELCSKSLAEYGFFPINISDWCLRRPVNIEVLAFLFRLTHSMTFIYIILNIIFTLALVWSYRSFSRVLSKLQGLGLLLVIFGLWVVFANNMVLSESIGLILGTLGVGLVSKLYENLEVKNIIFIAVILTLIQVIRPGNLASPFLLVVVVPMIQMQFKPKLLLGGLLFTIPVILPALIKSFSKLFSYNNYLTGGNAWASIYGLVNNNITWQQAYSEVPKGVGNSEIAINQYLKNQTISDFKDNPFQLAISILENLFDMTGDVFPFFSPVALSVSGIASVLLTATYILLALLMIRKVIQKSMGIPLKLLTLLFILSTILFYSVAWKSEAARSLSPTLPIFCFLILYIFRKNSEISITDLLNNKEKLKNYVAISILPFVIIASLMTINRVPERTFQLTDTTSACEPTEFVFNGKTLSLTSIDEINTSRVFGWSRLINQLPDGYLIQGIAHLENKPFAVTGFVETKDTLTIKRIVDSCFVIKTSSPNESYLSELNFVELEVIT